MLLLLEALFVKEKSSAFNPYIEIDFSAMPDLDALVGRLSYARKNLISLNESLQDRFEGYWSCLRWQKEEHDRITFLPPKCPARLS
jgi:hypothetical protein